MIEQLIQAAMVGVDAAVVVCAFILTVTAICTVITLIGKAFAAIAHIE